MRTSRHNRFEIVGLVALLCLALAMTGGLLWANAFYLRAASPDREFLVPWLGTRTFLRQGDSPYSVATAQQIQLWYYGRQAQQGEDLLQVTTPFPYLLLYFPFAFFSDYSLARNVWMVLNEIAAIAMAFFLMRLPAWKPQGWFLPVFCLLIVLWPQTLLGVLGGGTQLFAALAAVGALAVLKAGGKDELAGMLAVLALLQPAVYGPLVLFLFLWALAQRRWGMLWGFLMFLGILVLLAFFLLPGWFLPWVRNVLIERAYQPDWRPLAFLEGWLPGVGRRLAWLLTIGTSLLLMVEWFQGFRRDLRSLLWTAGLTLAMTPCLGVSTPPAGQIGLLFSLTLAVFLIGRRWGRSGRRWLPYLLLPSLFLGFWLTVGRLFTLGDWKALQAWLFWGLPVASLLGLYWLRWYAFRLPPTWLKEEL